MSNGKLIIYGVPILIWLSDRFRRKVLKSVKSWEIHRSFSNETECRKSLADHIRTKLPSYLVLEEDGNERRKVDISVSNSGSLIYLFEKKIAIELKYQLSKNTDLDRLIGQVMGYKELNFHRTIVVSIDPSPNFGPLLIKKMEIEGLEDFLEVVELKTGPK